MKIGIQTWGTRGDINPMLALAQGLQRNGHEVLFYYTCFTGVDFTHYSAEGLTVKSTQVFSQKEIEKVPFRKVYEMEISEGCDYILNEVYAIFEEQIYEACKLLCTECELIIATNLIYQAPCFAEKYNIPVFIVHVDSNYLDKELHQENLDRELNNVYLERVNSLRNELGLKQVRNVRTETLCSSFLNLMIYSKVFEDKEYSSDKNCMITGFMDLDTMKGIDIPEELVIFLRSGSAPVFFSLGSLTYFEEDLKEIIALFIKAIRLSGCRAIVQGDWKNYVYDFPADLEIYKINYVPHNMVFPHCLCVVHHGGAGTTHSALLNGCPSIVIAYAWDQFSWGSRLVKLGASPGLLKRKNIDEIQLAGSIRNVMVNTDYKEKAEYFRIKTKRENGVKRAVKLIEEQVANLIHA